MPHGEYIVAAPNTAQFMLTRRSDWLDWFAHAKETAEGCNRQPSELHREGRLSAYAALAASKPLGLQILPFNL